MVLSVQEVHHTTLSSTQPADHLEVVFKLLINRDTYSTKLGFWIQEEEKKRKVKERKKGKKEKKREERKKEKKERKKGKKERKKERKGRKEKEKEREEETCVRRQIHNLMSHHLEAKGRHLLKPIKWIQAHSRFLLKI